MAHEYDPSQQLAVKNGYPAEQVSVPMSANNSAVSWGAIFAGAAAAASLAMILLMLGTGLGLSSVSPWQDGGIDAKTFGIATIGWLTFTQIAASGMGGYISGRLRTKWVNTHNNEIYFRDTAHGFLAWAVASIISAVLLTSVIGSVAGTGARVIGSAAGSATALSAAVAGGDHNDSAGPSDASMKYFMNLLFRPGVNPAATNQAMSSNTPSVTTDSPVSAPQTQSVTSDQLVEVTGIFANGLSAGSLAPDDRNYVAQLVAQKTGISQQEAVQRVETTFTKIQTKISDAKNQALKVADESRKATSYIALWTFISLLIGAFVASFCATIGGRQRDL